MTHTHTHTHTHTQTYMHVCVGGVSKYHVCVHVCVCNTSRCQECRKGAFARRAAAASHACHVMAARWSVHILHTHTHTHTHASAAVKVGAGRGREARQPRHGRHPGVRILMYEVCMLQAASAACRRAI